MRVPKRNFKVKHEPKICTKSAIHPRKSLSSQSRVKTPKYWINVCIWISYFYRRNPVLLKLPSPQYEIINLILQQNVNLWPNPEFVTISPKMWICDKVPSKLLSGRSVAVGVLFSYWGYSPNSFRHLHTRPQNQFHCLEFIFQIFWKFLWIFGAYETSSYCIKTPYYKVQFHKLYRQYCHLMFIFKQWYFKY